MRLLLLLCFSARPNRSLVQLGYRGESLVHELLQASSLVRLGRIYVALGISGDAVYSVKLTGLSTAISEAGQNLKRIALNHVHLLIATIGNVDVLLLRVF